MKYTHDAIVKAEETLAERRKAALDKAEERENYVCERIPEVRKLKAQLGNSYHDLIKLIASHDSNAGSRAGQLKERSLRAQEQISQLVEGLTGDPDFMKPKFTCEKCKDTGFVEGERCECILELMKNYTVQELNARSGFTLHDFSEFDVTFYEGEEIQSKMLKWLDYLCKYCLNFPEDRRSILMLGPTGLGKTFLSTCVAKALAERGYEAAIGSAFDLLRRIEDEQFGRAEGNTLDSLLNADMLIIDDLGAEQPKAVYEIYLYNIINNRINLSRPTIISTNLNTKQLEQRYHERLTSRLIGNYIPFMFFGKDIRQQQMYRKYNARNGEQ